MQAYILRRLLALIPTLFFASLIVFITIRLIPGGIIDMMLSQNDIAAGADRSKIEAALGLDRPMLVQYFRWVGAVLQGDLGRSLWQNTPVTEDLLARLPVTFELGFLALLIGMPRCATVEPVLQAAGSGRVVACHLHHAATQ